MVAVHVVIALLAPLLTSYDPIANDANHALLGSSWSHWAGTDQYGRDVRARVLYGGRYALGVSVTATLLAASPSARSSAARRRPARRLVRRRTGPGPGRTIRPSPRSWHCWSS
ncbi:hypothetical protein ACRAWF_15675 [Streptomyces sp. L7]